MAIKVEIFNSSSLKYLPIRKVIKAIENTLEGESIKEAVVNVIYMDDHDIHVMNKDYLDHDYPTDVITFPLEEQPMEGEIYIGAETAVKQAEEYKVSLTNELLRLSIHGALHLCGYDDASDEERQNMHVLENKYLGIK